MAEFPSSNIRVLQICVAANMGGFLSGIQLALFSGILEMPQFAQAIVPDSALDAFSKSVITTALLVSFSLASPIAGPAIDRVGRRPALSFTAATFALASFLCLFSRSILHIVLCRLLAGVGYAVANIVCPMYTAEIAPSNSRGMLVNLYQLFITLGILFAQLANLIFVDSVWTAPVLCSLFPAVLMSIAVWLIVPESPVWVSSRSPNGTSSEVAPGDSPTQDLEKASPSTDASMEDHPPHRSNMSLTTLLADPSARYRLLIGCGLCAAQQWSGINAVIFFGPALLRDVLRWSGIRAGLQAAVIVGAANMLATVLSVVVVDHVGRRTLLLAGAPPMIASLVTLGGMKMEMISVKAVVGVGAVVVYVIAFAMTYGPLPFLVSAEIFPLRYKGIAMSTCSAVLGVSSMVVGLSFLPMLETMGGAVYFMYAACMMTASAFVWKVVPETRKLTLGEIDDLLERRVATS